MLVSCWAIKGMKPFVGVLLLLKTLNCVSLRFRPISEFFLVRDTSLIPNILWFEYTVTRSEAR